MKLSPGTHPAHTHNQTDILCAHTKRPPGFMLHPDLTFSLLLKSAPGNLIMKNTPLHLPAARRSEILLAQGAAVVIDFYYVRLRKKFMGQIF
jgi:hypothetical protein